VDKADHNLAILTTTIDLIYQSSPESDSEGGGEVNMVENGEEPTEKIVEEIHERLKKKLLVQLIWPGRQKEKKDTASCKMTQVHQKMSLGMTLP
jgi:hypothetical protein